MSRRALALGLRDLLRASTASGGLGLSVKECGLAPLMGKPPAAMGERYVGIWIGGRSTGRVTHGLKEVYTAYIAITYRADGMVPEDRLGDALVTKDVLPSAGGIEGFDPFVDSIRALVNSDYYTFCVMNRANVYIEADAATDASPEHQLFSRGLEFMGDDDPKEVGPSWFLGASKRQTTAGLVQVQRYGGMMRIQSGINKSSELDQDVS